MPMIGRLNIVKISILSKLTSRFRAVLIIILTGILKQIDNTNLTFIWKLKDLEYIKQILKKENKIVVLRLPGSKFNIKVQ